MVQEAVQWFGDYTPNVAVQVAPPSLVVSCDPPTIHLGSPVYVTITSRDLTNGQPVPGTILVNNVVIGNTNVQFP